MPKKKPSAAQEQIGKLDRQLLELLNERIRLARRADAGCRTQDARRELALWEAAAAERMAAANDGPLPAETLKAVYRELAAGAQAGRREALTVAFLGPSATFSHQAALGRFGAAANYLPCATIPEVFDAVCRGKAAFGVVPVENSTEGAVTYTLDVFAEVDVTICAEIHQEIHQHLLCRCAVEDVQVVYSHPSVFGQCREWLRKNLPQARLVPVTSTTEAASRAAAEEGAAALAGVLASERYGLPVRGDNIEDRTENLTRFFVIRRGAVCAPSGNDKTSLLFGVKDRVGALLDSLEPFRRHKISLSFIESRPSRRRNWEYQFYIDIAGHMQDAPVKAALEELSEHCQFVKCLGSYPRAAG